MCGQQQLLPESKDFFSLLDIFIRISLFLRQQREPLKALGLNQQGVNIPDRNPSMKTQHAVPSQCAENQLSKLKTKLCAHPLVLSRGQSTADTTGGMLLVENLGTAALCRHNWHSGAWEQGALQGPKAEVDAPACSGCCFRMPGKYQE